MQHTFSYIILCSCLRKCMHNSSWNLSMVIPIIEIEVTADMESDKKLDKLETFLGRLNNKGEVPLDDFDLL